MPRLLGPLRRWLERRGELCGMNQRNVELVYAENPRRFYPIADDKLLTKQKLAAASVPTPETLVECPGLFAIPAVLDKLWSLEDFVLKPATGGGGQGILVVGKQSSAGVWTRAGGRRIDAEEIRAHLAQIVFGAYSKRAEDRAFVERRIVPHETFSALWPDGLSDVRVLLRRAVPFMCMVRVPTARSAGRANLHQGALALAIDLESGRSVRAIYRRQSVELHPESGACLLGVEIPSWSDVLAIAVRAARAVPLGYLGVDVVVDRELGPLVLEINVRPGLEIQNVHGRGIGAALRDRLAREREG